MPPKSHSRFRLLAIAATVAAAATVCGAGTAANAGTGSVIDGPDVSSYQHASGAPNWNKVAADGKEFAIVKATEGSSYINPYFKSDYSGAHKAGLVRGSYAFARPAYPVLSTARSQADYFAAELGSTPDTKATLPPALDLEVTGGLSQPDLVLWAQTFLLELQRKTGRTPLLYTYPSFWTDSLGDGPAVKRFSRWMASYGGSAPAGSTLWQYTSTGSVKGIAGDVDLSRFTGTATDWATISNGSGGDPWPSAAPGAPQHVQAHAGSTTTTVSWMPGAPGSSDVTAYRVVASTAAGNIVKRVSPTTFRTKISGLTPEVTYGISVTAINAVGPGTPSTPLSVTTTLVPSVLSVTSPAPIVVGQAATTTLLLSRSDTGAGLGGKTITIERRRAGTTAWQAWTTVTTAENGTASVTMSHPRHDIDLRLSFAKTGFVSRTAHASVLVRSALSGVLSDHKIHAGKTVTISGLVGPVVSGLLVKRQMLTTDGWETVQRTHTFSDGSYRFTFTPTNVATLHLRTKVSRYDGREPGLSSTWRLTVR